MKQISLIAVILSLLVFFSSCSENKKTDVPLAAVDTTIVQVPTVKCEMCVDAITKSVGNMNGVRKVEVNLEKKTTMVLFTKDSVTLASIEQVIGKTGYDANGVKRDSAAYENLPPCCK